MLRILARNVAGQHSKVEEPRGIPMEDIRCNTRCGACDGELKVKRCVEASVPDVHGWRKVQHTLMRCRKAGCSRCNSTVGYNFYNVSNGNGAREQMER